mmetsp:Transcript_45085/g.74766  ORF Transcript_45085/g.74766 Transcript_45085/m.74766 type:complete len:139 (+) Transcript_45085:418-834(+)
MFVAFACSVALHVAAATRFIVTESRGLLKCLGARHGGSCHHMHSARSLRESMRASTCATGRRAGPPFVFSTRASLCGFLIAGGMRLARSTSGLLPLAHSRAIRVSKGLIYQQVRIAISVIVTYLELIQPQSHEKVQGL